MISEDWGGWDPLKLATELKVLDLAFCKDLRRTPDLSAFKSLEILNLGYCYNLKEIHPSIGKLTSLTELDLNFTAIVELSESIGFLKDLETLDVSYCQTLACIPSSIGNLASLSSLNLKGCDKLDQLPDSIGSLMSLLDLSVAGFRSLRQIPASIGKLTSLTKLDLNSTAIVELPESIGFLKDLETLDASYCVSLACIPSSIGGLASLKCLVLAGCHSLREIPASIGKLTSLTELNLNFTAIVELPESIGNMQNLRMLDISRTPAIKLLDDSGIMAELQELRAAGWKNQEGLPSGTDELVSLNKLDLDEKLSELRSRLLALVHLKRPRIPPANNSAVNYRAADSEHVLMRSRPFGISDEPPTIAAFGSGNATLGESLGDRGAPGAAMVGMSIESMADVKPRSADELGDKSRTRKLTEINEPWQCRSIRLPDNTTATRVQMIAKLGCSYATFLFRMYPSCLYQLSTNSALALLVSSACVPMNNLLNLNIWEDFCHLSIWPYIVN